MLLYLPSEVRGNGVVTVVVMEPKLVMESHLLIASHLAFEQAVSAYLRYTHNTHTHTHTHTHMYIYMYVPF